MWDSSLTVTTVCANKNAHPKKWIRFFQDQQQR
jgi:hypothetical protein